jgi:hypothetical protein
MPTQIVEDMEKAKPFRKLWTEWSLKKSIKDGWLKRKPKKPLTILK